MLPDRMHPVLHPVLRACKTGCMCACTPTGEAEHGAWCAFASCCVQRMMCCHCRIDMVLVGAEGVVENGGVINKLGTYQAALSAHCHNTPFYVAAESYKASVCQSCTR